MKSFVIQDVESTERDLEVTFNGEIIIEDVSNLYEDEFVISMDMPEGLIPSQQNVRSEKSIDVQGQEVQQTEFVVSLGSELEVFERGVQTQFDFANIDVKAFQDSLTQWQVILEELEAAAEEELEVEEEVLLAEAPEEIPAEFITELGFFEQNLDIGELGNFAFEATDPTQILIDDFIDQTNSILNPRHTDDRGPSIVVENYGSNGDPVVITDWPGGGSGDDSSEDSQGLGGGGMIDGIDGLSGLRGSGDLPGSGGSSQAQGGGPSSGSSGAGSDSIPDADLYVGQIPGPSGPGGGGGSHKYAGGGDRFDSEGFDDPRVDMNLMFVMDKGSDFMM